MMPHDPSEDFFSTLRAHLLSEPNGATAVQAPCWCGVDSVSQVTSNSKETHAHVNLAKYDLVTLRLILYCAECGSLTSAAKRAHVSLSQASYRISTLEDRLGVSFFRRSSIGLELTGAGVQAVKHGKEILKKVEQLSSSLFTD